MTLYHGSTGRVSNPTYGFGNPKNDYGLAFYCTEDPEMAKEWACREDGADGYVNRYVLEEQNLQVLDLMNGEYHVMNWFAILLENRDFKINSELKQTTKDYILSTFLPNYREADIIRGYRADDSYFSFANLFLDGGLSLEKLERVMRLGTLGEQIAIKSKRAFEHMKYQGSERVESLVYYPKRCVRDLKAREDFRETKSKENVLEGTFILDMLRSNWRNDDARLQRIVRK